MPPNSRLNGLLERVLFRRRYAIEMSLKRIDAHVDTYLSEEALVRQVVVLLTAQLELAGCAAYCDAEQSFLLSVAAGSASFPAEVLKADEPAARRPRRITGYFYRCASTGEVTVQSFCSSEMVRSFSPPTNSRCSSDSQCG